MEKIPDPQKATIARNIRACRLQHYPGHGGGKRCAEAFGVSPQQWSPWERGKRTPDEMRLNQIAEFFSVTVEYLQCDHDKQPDHPTTPFPANTPEQHADHPQSTPLFPPNAFTFPMPGMPPIEQPGSPDSFFWLLRHFVNHLITTGITIRLDDQSLARLAGKDESQA